MLLVIVLAFVALIILVWKVWKPLVKPPIKPIPPKEARLTMFMTEWCGFSQKAMPEWDALAKHVETSGPFGDTAVTLVTVDADADVDTATLYGIDAYPSVVLETSETTIEFTQRVTTDNLLRFLRTHLGQERESLGVPLSK
jgi:thiol-disulfide isomerase/thioredoxin